ncbi:hypothetical protein T12_2611 [Trichinella patagoniensis]|uniref:Uncharacterized protein n=1 Tax=Trichinella patagoniensis TaxID=990121 RepID=A0A0V0ZAJ5_9BILA|nr:hypothetical protein T12_2611 [Trichinella patagoniensis]
MALAFLPVNLVPAGFEILNVGTLGQMEALFQYFQREVASGRKNSVLQCTDLFVVDSKSACNEKQKLLRKAVCWCA